MSARTDPINSELITMYTWQHLNSPTLLHHPPLSQAALWFPPTNPVIIPTLSNPSYRSLVPAVAIADNQKLHDEAKFMGYLNTLQDPTIQPVGGAYGYPFMKGTRVGGEENIFLGFAGRSQMSEAAEGSITFKVERKMREKMLGGRSRKKMPMIKEEDHDEGYETASSGGRGQGSPLLGASKAMVRATRQEIGEGSWDTDSQASSSYTKDQQFFPNPSGGYPNRNQVLSSTLMQPAQTNPSLHWRPIPPMHNPYHQTLVLFTNYTQPRQGFIAGVSPPPGIQHPILTTPPPGFQHPNPTVLPPSALPRRPILNRQNVATPLPLYKPTPAPWSDVKPMTEPQKFLLSIWRGKIDSALEKIQLERDYNNIRRGAYEQWANSKEWTKREEKERAETANERNNCEKEMVDGKKETDHEWRARMRECLIDSVYL